MKFSLKSMIVFLTLLSVVFGVRSIYIDLLVRHRKKLEPSLFVAVLEISGKGYDQIYFANGHPLDEQWLCPPESLIDAMGRSKFHSIENKDELSPVHYVGNIKWLGWSSVKLDYGVFCGSEGGGCDDAVFQLQDGAWHEINYGRVLILSQ